MSDAPNPVAHYTLRMIVGPFVTVIGMCIGVDIGHILGLCVLIAVGFGLYTAWKM